MKSLAKKLGLNVRNFTAEYLYTMIRDGKVSYEKITSIDPKKFDDLENSMRLIFKHNDEAPPKRRNYTKNTTTIAAAS